jgi:hypothetical protein
LQYWHTPILPECDLYLPTQEADLLTPLPLIRGYSVGHQLSLTGLRLALSGFFVMLQYHQPVKSTLIFISHHIQKIRQSWSVTQL